MYRNSINQPDAEESDGNDMGDQTILGDVTNPTPIVVAGNHGGSDTLKTLATLALGGLLGGGGLAAGAAATYFLNKAPDVVEQITPGETERVEIGLGKIEDYLEQAK